MSTPGKQAQRTTKLTTAATESRKPVTESKSASQPVMVVDLIQNAIKSKLLPTDEDRGFREFRGEFEFQGNLREYVRLQGQAWGGNKKLSALISFTSADPDVDVLALPTSKYVRDTWKQNGAKLLQLIERALYDTENQGVSGRKLYLVSSQVQADKMDVVVLTHNTRVSITIHETHLFLQITGAEIVFPHIVEQVCWVVSVAGENSISLLEKYVRETSGGKRTRGYAETLHAGKPVITAGTDGCFKVSFRPYPTEVHMNHSVVARTGNCWKTMAGLSIVANGYKIPKRPKQGSGLEASLYVLGQLFRRGCTGKPVVPLDKPMVMIPTKVGKGHEAYELRLIMAVGAQQFTKGNAIYWHFDPAKLCASSTSCEQLEKQIRVGPSMIGPWSRHFVGWSTGAGFLAGKQPNNSWGWSLGLAALPERWTATCSGCLPAGACGSEVGAGHPHLISPHLNLTRSSFTSSLHIPLPQFSSSLTSTIT